MRKANKVESSIITPQAPMLSGDSRPNGYLTRCRSNLQHETLQPRMVNTFWNCIGKCTTLWILMAPNIYMLIWLVEFRLICAKQVFILLYKHLYFLFKNL